MASAMPNTSNPLHLSYLPSTKCSLLFAMSLHRLYCCTIVHPVAKGLSNGGGGGWNKRGEWNTSLIVVAIDGFHRLSVSKINSTTFSHFLILDRITDSKMINGGLEEECPGSDFFQKINTLGHSYSGLKLQDMFNT